MLKVRRPPLDPSLQAELERRQAAVDGRRAGAEPWKDFTEHERALAEESQRTVRNAVATMFHDKCGYCEARGGSQIDHHRPKSRSRGRPGEMFRWENLVWSCTECNGVAVKGSHMAWEAGSKPRMLDPTAPGDDPLCHFTIQQAGAPAFTMGWIDPREGLNAVATRRARYTIEKLKLNRRGHLVEARADVLARFQLLEHCLEKLGPDEGPVGGPTVRQSLIGLLSPEAPYLAAIRQCLREAPERKQKLLARVPELGPLLDSWDLPPDDDAPLRAPPRRAPPVI